MKLSRSILMALFLSPACGPADEAEVSMGQLCASRAECDSTLSCEQRVLGVGTCTRDCLTSECPSGSVCNGSGWCEAAPRIALVGPYSDVAGRFQLELEPAIGSALTGFGQAELGGGSGAFSLRARIDGEVIRAVVEHTTGNYALILHVVEGGALRGRLGTEGNHAALELRRGRWEPSAEAPVTPPPPPPQTPPPAPTCEAAQSALYGVEWGTSFSGSGANRINDCVYGQPCWIVALVFHEDGTYESNVVYSAWYGSFSSPIQVSCSGGDFANSCQNMALVSCVGETLLAGSWAMAGDSLIFDGLTWNRYPVGFWIDDCGGRRQCR